MKKKIPILPKRSAAQKPNPSELLNGLNPSEPPIAAKGHDDTKTSETFSLKEPPMHKSDVDKIRLLIKGNLKRFQRFPFNDDTAISDPLGYKIKVSGVTEYLIFPKTFNHAAGGRKKAALIKSALDKKKLITKDKNGKFTVYRNVGSDSADTPQPKKSFVIISGKILD